MVAECENVDPKKILFWIDKLNTYASLNDEHDALYTFPNVTCEMIAADPIPYLDEMFSPSGLSEHILPWQHFTFFTKDGIAIPPYPEVCHLHQVSRSHFFEQLSG
jgi:hypothetical protein